MRIWIDNGHGAGTKGKQSPDGRLREYAYARDIARRVVDALKKKGLDAQLLVPEEEDISLQERCARANRVKDSILVSVHCNAAGSGTQWMTARGWEAWTSVGQTKADKLAECLYQSAEQVLKGMKIRKDTADGDSDKESGFYILKHTVCPAVLTENLFQDNREDVDFLLSDEAARRLSRCMCRESVNTWAYETASVDTGRLAVGRAPLFAFLPWMRVAAVWAG
mgnify:CR=1 FL=1